MICLVTGASSGLGFAMAQGLAKTGATVVMLCRDRERGQRARVELIAGSGNPNIDLMPCDLSSLEDVRRFAAEFQAYYPHLDVLANLAGLEYPRRKLSPDGYEYNLAANVLGPFLLTNLLIGSLLAGAPATILNVSGEAHRTGAIHFDDLQLKRRFPFKEVRGQTALARVVWTYELTRRLAGTGITANTFCPGWTRSRLLRYYPAALRWPRQAAAHFFAAPAGESMRSIIDFTLREALQGESGLYLSEGKAIKSVPITYRSTLGRRLWLHLANMTGTKGHLEEAVRILRAIPY